MRTPMQGIIIVPDDDDDFPATICTVASPDGCPSERRPDRPLRRCHICGGRPPPRRFCPASHVACLACGKAGQLLPCLRVSTSVATTRPWEAQQPFHPRRPNPANGGVIHQGAPKHRVVLQHPECCCSGEALFPLEPSMSAAAPPAALPAVLPAEGPQEAEEPVPGHEAALAAEDVQSASTTSDRAAVLVLSPPSVSTPSWSHQRPRRRYSTASVVCRQRDSHRLSDRFLDFFLNIYGSVLVIYRTYNLNVNTSD